MGDVLKIKVVALTPVPLGPVTAMVPVVPLAGVAVI